MSILTPRTWVTGEIVTAAYMNTEVRDAVNTLQIFGSPVAAIAPITANQGSITAAVDVTGGSLTYTFVAGHRYRFKAGGLGCTSTVATDGYQIALLIAGTTYQGWRGFLNTTFQSSFSIDFAVACVAGGASAPTQMNAGSTICKLQVSRSGTGTLQLGASANFPTTFEIIDGGN